MHARLPILSSEQIEKAEQCQIPVVNVYTDFFINDVWGRNEIDYHFAPSQDVKNDLIKRDRISEDRIFITGIPIGEQFDQHTRPPKDNRKWNILVSGGSVGLGNIIDIVQPQGINQVDYFVLCGKNNKLYQKLKALSCNNIHPLPYIFQKKK